MSSKPDRLRQAVNNVMSSLKWDLHSELEIVIQEMPHQFMAGVDKNWDAHIALNPDIETHLKKAIKEQKLKRVIRSPLEKAIKTLLLHEKGHWDICPFDIYPFEEIVSGCSTGLKESGFRGLDAYDLQDRNLFVGALKYFINTFEDLAVNIVNSVIRDPDHSYQEGNASLRLLEGYSAKNGIDPLPGYPMTKCSTIISIMESVLCYEDERIYRAVQEGQHPDRQELEKHALTAFSKILKDKKLAELAIKRELNQEDRRAIALRLYDRSPGNWYAQSLAYTRTLAPFFKEDQDQMMEDSKNMQGSPLSQELFSDEGMSSAGSQEGQEEDRRSWVEKMIDAAKDLLPKKDDQGEEDDDDKDGKGKGGKDKEKGKSKEEKGEDDKPEELYDDLNQEMLKQLIGIGTEIGRKIDYAKNFELFRELYRSRAEKLFADFVDKKREGSVTPIAHLTRTLVDSENLDLRTVDWAQSRVHHTPRGRRLELYQKEIPEVVEDPMVEHDGAFPDLAFIVDTSGSMKSNLIRGIGPYDSSLRADFSLLKLIEEKEKMYQMNFAAVNFSGRTHYSGWHDYHNLDAVLKDLFRFQNGGTKLNPDTIRQLYEESQYPFLAMLTTDGLLDNPREAALALQELVETGNHLCVIYLKNNSFWSGNEDKIFLSMLEDHAEIHRIDKPEDLIGIHLGKGEEYWGSVEVEQLTG